MWMNQLFSDNPINFEKRCKSRMKIGLVFALLGAVSLGMTVFLGKNSPVLYLEQNSLEWVRGYYRSFGIALIAAGIAVMMKNARYLKNPALRKKQEITETDERNRLLGLRCWAYTGYGMFLILYVGVLVSGFISMTVLMTLQAVIVVYALLLLIFRIFLSRRM